MIRYTTGDLFAADTQAIVNPVNTAGVMGCGLALEFKKRFPSNFRYYFDACRKGEVRTGKMLVCTYDCAGHRKYIVNFPTKRHWKYPSKMAYIESGLEDLVSVISAYGIESIAVPPLGCGAGRLAWISVRPLIERCLNRCDGTRIVVYEPSQPYLSCGMN